MDYPEFRKTIFEYVRELLPDSVSIRMLDVEKLNSSLRFGILFTKENAYCSPTIYLESFYSAYLKGEDVWSLAKEMIRCYNEEIIEPPECIFHLSDFTYTRENLFAKLIRLKGNENLLKNVPFQMYLDFAIIPYYELGVDEILQGTILINDKFLELWDITSEDLLRWAIQNTKEKKMVYFADIVEVLDGNLTNDEKISFQDISSKMYVLTNDKKQFGAVWIYYSEILQMVQKKLGEDYYLVPASIHEWIVMPESSVKDTLYLKWMVNEVNRTQLLPEEVLSNNIYLYDSETGDIVLC